MQDTIVKTDNELIAEFMGLSSGGAQPPYHCNWYLLMSVIERIYNLEDGVKRRGVTFTLKNSKASIKDGKKSFSCHTISPLNSSYRVVVEFIKWYNTQKP